MSATNLYCRHKISEGIIDIFYLFYVTFTKHFRFWLTLLKCQMSRNHVDRRLLSSPSCVFGSIAMAFKFLFALRTKRKKTFHLDDLPLFKWDDISAKEVIGQGAFGGAVFITRCKQVRRDSCCQKSCSVPPVTFNNIF